MFGYIQRWPWKWHGRAEESRDDLAPTCSFHPLHIVEDQPVCLGSHGFFSGIMATVPSLCTWQGSNILLNIEGLPSLGCSFLASHLDGKKKKKSFKRKECPSMVAQPLGIAPWRQKQEFPVSSRPVWST